MHCVIYGIANCVTVKKARNRLSFQGVEFEFHDYNKSGNSEEVLRKWCATAGWEALPNERGLTWKKLIDAAKASVDESKALRLMAENSGLIRQPVQEIGGYLAVGFSARRSAQIFSF